MNAVSHARPAGRGPVRRTERTLAPDLARGAMLLFIALAHSAMAIFARVPGAEPDPQGLERGYNLFMFTIVHARALPLFAIMFGYGLVQLSLRQEAAAGRADAARGVLLRRNAWLFAFGLVHGVLLFSGDILGAYGIIGVVLTLLLVGRGERMYRVALWYLGFVTLYVLGLASAAGWSLANGSGEPAAVPGSDYTSGLAPTYPASVLDRIGEWPITTLLLSTFIFSAWLGAWAARRRILEDPARHRRLLTVGATAGLAAGIAGGTPMGLLAAGWLQADDSAAALVKLLHESSGIFGGIGFVCLFGLLALAYSARRNTRKPSVAVGALTALGQRSLSGYLLQSVAWLALAAPFALSIADRVASPALAALACGVGVWLATVAAAAVMQRYAVRGPAEVLLRRLAYGRAQARGR